MKLTLKQLKTVIFTTFILLLSFNSFGQVTDTSKNRGPLNISIVAELGYLSVLDHKIQFGITGTYLDYNETGGQDVLFPFSRISINTQWKRNTFVLLYQPLLLETSDLADQDLVIDSLTFPQKTGVKFIYNFPFYRFSYMYELMVPESKWDVGLGLSLQIRNATISFESTDGERYRTNRDVGLVPALKARVNFRLKNNFWMGTELDGIYAPVSYLNGDNNDVEGAILDASIRAGYTHNKIYTLFLNLRYLGGGAKGQSDNYEPPSDGYVKNWLHFFTLSVGAMWEIF
jgi:hypothetical protein